MDILTIFGGAIATYLLHNNTKFCATKSSALITLAAYALTYFLPFNLALFFGGTFIGMSIKEKINLWQLVASCLAYQVIFNFVVDRFPTIGGSLGFSAFVSVAITFSAAVVFRRNRDQHT